MVKHIDARLPKARNTIRKQVRNVFKRKRPYQWNQRKVYQGPTRS